MKKPIKHSFSKSNQMIKGYSYYNIGTIFNKAIRHKYYIVDNNIVSVYHTTINHNRQGKHKRSINVD